MGCSNARLLVQQSPLEENSHAISSRSRNLAATTAENRVPQSSPFLIDDHLQSRVHLNGVDLVVERNGSYTLLLTPKTHKQLMPYVMRKKRFRILVDKQSSSTALNPSLSTTKPIIHQQINVQSDNNISNNDINHSTMESSKELKIKQKHNKRTQLDKNVEFIEQQADNELEKSKRQLDQQILGGTPIDNNLEDEYLHSDDEGMVEEIITTVEEDKDLECKVKKKIETKKTVAEDPETHNKVTKVVKTEVTEITRTITINDQHDLERAKRELGIDDVNKLLPYQSGLLQQNIYNLPSSQYILPSYLTTTSGTSWADHPKLTEIQEVRYDPSNEIVTSGDFGEECKEKTPSPTYGAQQLIKQSHQLAAGTQDNQRPIFNNEATLAGKGIDATISAKPVVDSSTSQKPDIQPSTTTTTDSSSAPVVVKKKAKSGGLCSCASARGTTSDDERKHEQTKIVEKKSKLKKKTSVSPVATITATTDQAKSKPVTTTSPTSFELLKSAIEQQTIGKALVSDPIKQLIITKKQPLIDYFHTQIFSTKTNLITSKDNDGLCRKISSRIFDLLRYDRCSSWQNLQDQIREEYGHETPSSLFIQPICETYETIFTTKEPQLLKLFENETTIPSANQEFIEIVQQKMSNRNKSPNIGYAATQFVNNVQGNLDRLAYGATIQQQQNENIGEQKERPLATKDSGITTSFSASTSGEFRSGDNRSITPDTMTESHPPHLEEEPSLTVDDHQLNEITNKILAQTNNKSITLAEAVAYDYLDLNDFDVVHSLGLQLDVADKMKKVFLPINESDIKYGHDYKHNIVKVQRSGETIAELDLADPNALEKINLPSNVVAHLQYAFEQPLNLREKQLKQLSDALERTGDLQFAISPLYPPFSKYWQEQQNDLSTSDSGYSMTTTSANDSSKQQQPQSTMVKIDFEPIVEPKIKSSLIETQTGVDLGSSTSDRDDGSEKIDLDKATVEQLDQYQLNQGLVQKIKQKDTGKDKTLGQQILDQEVNLDDINYLKQLNLDNRQANILKEFFFPTTHSKQTPKKRIISYSPEPGRFIELTTIYNQSIEHRGEGGADTKIIHIQEKQLSSVEHAMKRNVETEDPYYSQPHVSVSKQLPKTQPSTVSSHDEIKPPPIDIKKIESPIVHLKSEPVETKKRKSSGTGGLFACFGSKKSKSDTIRASTSGQAPVDKPTTPTASAPIFIQQTSASTIPPKSPVADCFLTKDGKRIYIDEYRERPGLDMSYVPPNFETNYFKPQVIKKQSLEYEEQFHALPATNDDNKTPEIEQTQSPPVIDIQQESAPQFPERSSLESASAVHLEPRQPTFEIVKTDKETKPVEEQILITTPPSQNTTTTSLHGAAVKLPVVDLQKPGPVEANLSSTKQEPIKVKVPKTKKEKSSTGGLCASCFGTKAKKQKQEGVEPKEKVKTDKKTSSEITRKDDDINKQHISPTVSVPKIDIKGPAVDIKPPTLPNIQTNLSSTTSPPPIDIETKIMDTAAFKSEDPHVDIDLNLKHDKTVPPLSTVSDKLANSVIPEFSINGPDLNLNVNKTEHSISSFEVPDLNIHVNTDKEVLPPTTTTFDVSDIKVPNVFDSEIIHDRDLRMGEIPDIKFYEQKQPTIDTVTDDINLKQQIPDYIVPSLPKVDIEDRTYDIPHVEADKTLISLPVAELPKLHIKGPDLDIHIENKKPEVRVETAELQGASGDFVVEAPTAELPKIDLKGPTVDLNLSGDSHKPITQTINIASQMPKVDVRDSAKGSYTLPTTVDETKSKKKKEKKEKKDKKDKKEKEEDNSSSSNGGLFGGFFKGKKSSKLTAPNVTLPSVDKSINIPPSLVISSDPLKVPSADLPKVKDVDFPTYDRPEVLATSKKNEFQVPSVSLPSIEGVNLPTQNIPDAFHFNRTSDQILQAPFTQLPDVEFTSNVPEKQIQEVPSTKSNMPIIEMGLPLATPIIDTTNQQLPNVNISKDFHFRTEESLDIDKPTTNALAKVNTPDSTVNLDKTILSSIESNYDIPSPAFRIDHKTEQIEALKPLDINFENPPTSSIASPELNVDIKHRDISPSFDIPDVDLNLNKSLAGPAPSSFDIPDVDLNLNKRSAAPAPPSFETDRSLTKPSISELIHDKNVQLGNIPDIKLYEQKQPTVSVKQTKVPDVPEIHLPKLDVTTDVKPVITKPQPIESAIHPPKKAKSGLCSCFGEKAAHKTTINKTETTVPKVKSTKTKIQAPVAKLPDVNLPALESTEVQKSKGKPLKAPVADLPPLDLKPPQSTDALLNTSLTKRPAPKLPDLPKPEIPKATKDLVIPDIGNIQTPSISEQIVPTDINISPIDQPEFKLRGPDILLESTTKPQLLSSHEAKYNLNDTHIVSESPEIKLKDIPSVPIGSVTTNVDYDIPKHINESSTEKQETHTHIKKGPSFEMKAPVMDIPDLDLKVSSLDESEANLSFKKHPQVSEEKLSVSHNIPSIPHLIDQHPHQQAPTTSRSDSGLEQIVSSHIHPSLTFGTDQSSTYDFSNSVSSGLGSEIIDGVAHKGYTLPSIKTTYEHPEIRTTDGKRLSIPTREGGIHYDFNKKITLNDDIHSKLVFRQQELKKLLETEISSTMDDFDGKKDHKHLQKIIQHSIDLIKDKKVSSYPELKTQLIMAHKNEAYIVDPVVKSLYLTIEKHNLDNIDRPEVALAIRDMVKDSAKQTINTITHLNTGTTNKPEPIQQSPPKQQPDTIPKLIVDSTKDARKIGEVVSKDVIPSIDVAPSQSQISATTTSTKEKQKSPIEKDDKHVAPKTPTAASSCLTCGRHPKSKSSATTTANVVDTKSATATGAKHSLLDERRHQQLNASKNELAATIREHIQSSSPPIKNMKDHSKDVDKIIRKTLQILVSPKVYSYEQVRNDLKTEYKQTFYLVDPIVDIVRDTLERCDIQNMQDKINVDILDANIKQTQELYNQTHGQQLLSTQELEYLQQNQTGFIKSIKAKEKEEKKINKKQEKELQKILERTCDILSTQQVHTWDEIHHQLKREYPKTHDLDSRAIELLKSAQMDGRLKLTEKARQTLVKNKSSIVSSIVQLLLDHNKNLYEYSQIEKLVNQTFDYLEQNNQNKEFRNYNDLKEKLKRDHSYNHDVLIEQIVDVIEQAHVTSQFEDMDKNEVQTLMKDRLHGNPLILKQIHVQLPPRQGAYVPQNQQQQSSYLNDVSGDSTHPSVTNGTNSHASRQIARGLSWREANERARILFYRGRHPAIHYDEKTAGFDVRMLLETQTGVQQEIPVTDEDVHRLLNTCGVQWDGINVVSLIDRSEAYVKEAERDALKLIKESGTLDQLKLTQQQQKINDEQQTVTSSTTMS